MALTCPWSQREDEGQFGEDPGKEVVVYSAVSHYGHLDYPRTFWNTSLGNMVPQRKGLQF